MKVLYLINYAGSGGAERYVENLMERVDCGLCFHEDGPLADKARRSGIPTHTLKMTHPLDLSAARRLAVICKTHGYAVIHAQFPRENCIAILSRLFGCRARVVFTAHLTVEQPGCWRILNRIFTPKNHSIIAVCSASAQILQKNGADPSKIKIIPNGIMPTQTKKDRSVLAELGIGAEAVITTLARFSPEKGLDFLCDAIARLKAKTGIPFRVLLVGDGAEYPAIQTKIAELGLSNTVLLPGYRTDTAQLLAASDIYVNSSRSEAMSFAILEAMAASLPVVATDAGGNPDLIDEDCGFLIPGGDAEAFSHALLTLLENEPLRRRMGAAARQKVETKYHQNHLIHEILETYQDEKRT